MLLPSDPGCHGSAGHSSSFPAHVGLIQPSPWWEALGMSAWHGAVLGKAGTTAQVKDTALRQAGPLPLHAVSPAWARGVWGAQRAFCQAKGYAQSIAREEKVTGSSSVESEGNTGTSAGYCTSPRAWADQAVPVPTTLPPLLLTLTFSHPTQSPVHSD